MPLRFSWSQSSGTIERLCVSMDGLLDPVVHQLPMAGKLDPRQPRPYGDGCIAVLARQIGATPVTTNPADSEAIARFLDFRYRTVDQDGPSLRGSERRDGPCPLRCQQGPPKPVPRLEARAHLLG